MPSFLLKQSFWGPAMIFGKACRNGMRLNGFWAGEIMQSKMLTEAGFQGCKREAIASIGEGGSQKLWLALGKGISKKAN